MSHRYALLAAKLLARGAPAAGGRLSREGARPLSDGDREDAILAMGRAIGKRRRTYVVLQWAWVADVALLLGASGALYATHRAAPAVAAQPAPAAAASAITVVGHPSGGGALVRAPEVAGPAGETTSTSAPLADGKALEAGSRIVTRADGHVVLSLSTGTHLTIEEGGDLTIVDNGPNQVFSIHTGAMRADVAKLEGGQRFVVRTPDSEIEVHGTSFRVAIADGNPACGGGTTTRVTAFEGVVSVRHGSAEVRVTAGQEWPSDCVAARPASPPPPTHRAGLAMAPKANPAAPPRPAAPETSPPAEAPASSDLAEQNNAFARAVAMKRQGASKEALAAFEAFAARYPSSPLLESALVERMRLLAGDRSRAGEAARQYLSRYPAGVARDEARAIERDAP
jgi:hypothetical protein